MGEYAHNIDRKGRLIMPAKFREELGEHVVVNRGLDGCLYVYTVEQWQYMKNFPLYHQRIRMLVCINV